MLSPERRSLLLWGSLLPFLAAGCTFRPLYRPKGRTDSSPNDQLSEIQIVPLSDRLGQLMHNALRNELNPKGQPRRPRYSLQLGLSETIEEIGIRLDETASRNDITLVASFSLVRAGSQEVLMSAQASVTDSYDVLASAFATDTAQRAARERNVRRLAKQVRLQLASHFSNTELRSS